MAKTKFEYTADDQQVIAALERQQAENAKLLDQLTQLRNESEQGGRSQVDSMDKVVTKLAGVAAGVLTVREAWQLVNAEIENNLQLNRDRADLALTESETEIALLRNLGAENQAQADAVIANIGKIASETGVSVRDLNQAGSTAFSARGNLSTEATLGAVRAGAQIAPENAAEAEAITGGLLDLAKFSGSVDPEENLGFLLSVGQTARVTSPARLAQNVVPAIQGVKGTGGTLQESAALVAATTQAAADPTGAASGTAATSLAIQLREALPDLAGPLERVSFLQDNPQAAAAFLRDSSFERRFQIPFEQLLTDADSPISQNVSANLGRIPQISDASQAAQNQLGIIGGTGRQPVAQFQRAIESTRQDLLRAGDPQGIGAGAGVLLESGEDLLRASGAPALEQRVAGIRQRFGAIGGDPTAQIEQFQGILGERIQQLERTGVIAALDRVSEVREGAAPELRDPEVRSEMADQIRGLRAEIREFLRQAQNRRTTAAGAQE